ncbi:MAG: hypothetical protein KTQ49_00300 [Candidatus Omnitrophica bacterium]|nr:hypothetical protein [Candidatus Omnitrophota bacterium]
MALNSEWRYFLKYFLPGAAFILCAFWAGTLPSMTFSCLGFLSFFCAGVMLIVEGKKRSRGGQRPTDSEKF